MLKLCCKLHSWVFVYRLKMAKYQNKIDPKDIFASDDKSLNSERISQYICSICKYLLDNPVQADCGDRFCQDCYKDKFTDRLAIFFKLYINHCIYNILPYGVEVYVCFMYIIYVTGHGLWKNRPSCHIRK